MTVKIKYWNQNYHRLSRLQNPVSANHRIMATKIIVPARPVRWVVVSVRNKQLTELLDEGSPLNGNEFQYDPILILLPRCLPPHCLVLLDAGPAIIAKVVEDWVIISRDHVSHYLRQLKIKLNC
jgi:hypothetical protein